MRKFLLLALLPLAACATVVNGTSQDIAVNTTPAGAACDLSRQGSHIGNVLTPGSLHMDKSGKDLNIVCSKDGYVPAKAAQSPSFSGATFGNILVGGVIGAVVDASTGANYSYHDFDLTLQPDQTLPPVASSREPLRIIPSGYHVVRD